MTPPALSERTDTRLGTFYYDEGSKQWRPITRLASAAGPQALTSATDHFTDFVSATLAMPEHPEADLFNATSLKDLKLGEPAAGVSLIEPPVARSSGAAQVSYPLEVPPGRSGVQPRLEASYSSENQGTWLGTGWDLSMSRIEIDTRFGVPQYTGGETYLLDGEALTPAGALPTGGELFRRRVEGPFERIVRLGTDTTSYHFEITSKDGTKFVYGRACPFRVTNGQDPGSCLRRYPKGLDDPQHIFRWQLESVTDLFGNRMDLKYALDQGSNGEPFVQLYPARIDYTAHGPSGLRPQYHVDFVLENGERVDRIIDGRPGFQVLTRRRLGQVDVRFHEEVIRRYVFAYKTGDFGKSLLAAINVKGFDGTDDFYNHTFDYFTAPRDPEDPTRFAIFSRPPVPVEWGQVRADSGLSRNEETAAGAGALAGFGIPLFNATVEGSAYGAEDTTRLTFLDLNDDGMPDQFDDVGTLSRNLLQLTPSATNHFLFSPLAGVVKPALGHSDQSGRSVGGGINIFGVEGSVSYTRSRVRDDRLITDMNGDGFVDLVASTGGQVRVRLSTGRNSFEPIERTWGQLSDVPTSNPDRNAKEQIVPADMLMRWIAPFSGTITMAGAVQRQLPGGGPFDDGVEGRIYRGNTLLWQRVFLPGDTSPCVPSAGNGCDPAGLTFAVTGGDRLYFKASALNNQLNDELSWAPTITYQVAPADLALLEPTGSPIFRFSQADDFRLAGPPNPSWMASARGVVRISGAVTKDTTPDDITIEILKGTVNALNRPVTTPLFTEVLDANAAVVRPLELTVPVNQDDLIFFRVTARTPFDPARISWRPEVRYTNLCRHPQTGAEVCGDLTCVPDVAGNQVCTIAGDPLPDDPVPLAALTANPDVFYSVPQYLPGPPTQTFIVPPGGGGLATFTGRFGFRGPGTVIAQGVNRRLFSQSVGPGIGNIATNFTAEVTEGEQLFFTVIADDPVSTVSWVISMNGQSMPVNERVPDQRFAFDPMRPLPDADGMSGGYHRWFFGEWAGGTFDERLIQLPDPSNPRPPFLFLVPLRDGTAEVGLPQWAGRSDAFIAAGQLKPSRVALGGRFDALRVASTWNLDFNAGLGVTTGFSMGDTTSERDLFDVNGDRFPDVVTAGAVQLNDGQSGFRVPQVMPGGFPDLREIVHRTARVGLGVNGKLINLTNAQGASTGTVSTGFNLGLTYGLTATHTEFADVNGDGLPDQVRQKPDEPNLRVRLNLGYEYSAEIVWPRTTWEQSSVGIRADLVNAFSNAVRNDVVRLQDNGSLGVGGGGSIDNIGAGGGVAFNLTRTLVDLVDLNGDGLADQVMKLGREGFMRVKMNLGQSFGPEERWTTFGFGEELTPVEFRLYGSESDADVIGFRRARNLQGSVSFKVCFIFCVGGSAFFSRGNGTAQLGFEDIDGDGKLDHVFKADGNPTVKARLNQVGKTNLLMRVNRPLGGRFTIDYRRAGNRIELGAPDAKIDMPKNQWVLGFLDVDDGRGNHIVNDFFYDVSLGIGDDSVAVGSGFFDRVERENYGYSHVRTNRRRADGSLDSSVDEFFHNQDYYRRGLRTRTVEADGTNNVFRVVEVAYANPTPLGLAVRTGSFFPKESTRTTSFFERIGDDSSPTALADRRVETRIFDSADSCVPGSSPACPELGNLTRLIDEGEPDDLTDDVNYHIAYFQDVPQHIFKPGLVTARTGKNDAGVLLRRRNGLYGTKGELTHLFLTLIGGNDPATGAPYDGTKTPAWRYEYDEFGNLHRYTDPKGFTLSYEYDNEVRTHRISTRDAFGWSRRCNPTCASPFPTRSSTSTTRRRCSSTTGSAAWTAMFGPYELPDKITPTLAVPVRAPRRPSCPPSP